MLLLPAISCLALGIGIGTSSHLPTHGCVCCSPDAPDKDGIGYRLQTGNAPLLADA